MVLGKIPSLEFLYYPFTGCGQTGSTEQKPTAQQNPIGWGTTVPCVKAAGFLHMTHTSSYAKKFAVGDYSKRQHYLRQGIEVEKEVTADRVLPVP